MSCQFHRPDSAKLSGLISITRKSVHTTSIGQPKQNYNKIRNITIFLPKLFRLFFCIPPACNFSNDSGN